MNKETLFTIDIKELDNPFEREKLESLPNYILVELLIRHLKREIKAIEYIKEHSEMTDLQICGIENVLAFRGSATKLLEILGGDKE